MARRISLASCWRGSRALRGRSSIAALAPCAAGSRRPSRSCAPRQAAATRLAARQAALERPVAAPSKWRSSRWPANGTAMEPVRKQKWLDIANRFASMKPDEQQRMHERMRDWVKLTPEERRLARENYTRPRKSTRARRRPSGSSTSSCPKKKKASWPPMPRARNR